MPLNLGLKILPVMRQGAIGTQMIQCSEDLVGSLKLYVAAKSLLLIPISKIL